MKGGGEKWSERGLAYFATPFSQKENGEVW